MRRISDSEGIPPDKKEAIQELLLSKTADDRSIALDLDMASFGDENETTLKRAAESLAKLSGAKDRSAHETPSSGLPRMIYFPYSRHSSYPELCEFVGAFKPRDVWPCTVNPVAWMNDGTAPPATGGLTMLTILQARASRLFLASGAPAIPSNTT